MVMRLTPNGFFVRTRVALISLSSSAGVMAPQAMIPNAPAFEMAATRLRSDTQVIAPQRIAISQPRKSVPRFHKDAKRGDMGGTVTVGAGGAVRGISLV